MAGPTLGGHPVRAGHGRGGGQNSGRPPVEVQDLGRELRTMINPRLWLSYGTTALSTGAQLVIFAYLGALLARTTGISENWIPLVLICTASAR